MSKYFDDDLLDETQAAQFLGSTISTLQKWRLYTSNGPRFLKLGSRVRYRVSDLRQWISDRTVSSTSDAARLPRVRSRKAS
jgi:predicted DNA-binding transcriptional regulator AlpA